MSNSCFAWLRGDAISSESNSMRQFNVPGNAPDNVAYQGGHHTIVYTTCWVATQRIFAPCGLGTHDKTTAICMHTRCRLMRHVPPPIQTASPRSTKKMHWNAALDAVAAVARVTGCGCAASLATMVLLWWSTATIALAATCVAVGALARCPCFAVVHVLVDHPNVLAPLLARKRRLAFPGLRRVVLMAPHPPPEWAFLAARATQSRWHALATLLLTRRAGTMVVCGCGNGGNRNVHRWRNAATDAGFTVLILRVVPEHHNEETVDAVLHKIVANATLGMASQSGVLARARALARGLGVGSLLPRDVLVQVGGDRDNRRRGHDGSRGLARALSHGMHVEVWSWGASMSAVYRAMHRDQSRWSAERLHLVTLDRHEGVVSMEAPPCHFGSACNKQRTCSFSHPPRGWPR